MDFVIVTVGKAADGVIGPRGVEVAEPHCAASSYGWRCWRIFCDATVNMLNGKEVADEKSEWWGEMGLLTLLTRAPRHKAPRTSEYEKVTTMAHDGQGYVRDL